MMPRVVLAALLAWSVLAFFPANAATSAAGAQTDPVAGDSAQTSSVLAWMKGYRAKPEPARLPAAAIAMSRFGAFREPDAAGLYVGFIAGVLNANPGRADKLVAGMLPIAPEDHWVIVRAIAYSGLPQWRALLKNYAPRLPTRSVMIDAYLTGKLPTLGQFAMPETRTAMQQVQRAVTFWKKDEPPAIRLEPSPLAMETLWGFYFATGSDWPLQRLLGLLPWSEDHNDVARLTIGSTAKYTLANYAARDARLLTAIKRLRPSAGPEATPVLDKVIFAAETVEIEPIRAEAQAAIADLRARGPDYKRKVAWWGQVGEGAISLGCVVAAATGQAYLGLPCVIGGATASAMLRYFGAER
ncbi:MAG: hypothetical protein U1E56_02095 [Bauldia sp.]